MVESRCTTDHYCLEMARGACVPARALACALPCIHLVLHALLVFSSIERSVLVYKYISYLHYHLRATGPCNAATSRGQNLVPHL